MTVIEFVVSPVLHNREPVNPEAVNTEYPQLLAIVTSGAGGISFGAAIPLPSALEHPPTVWVKVYVPPVVTIIDSVVSPLLHNNPPVYSDAVNTELPQLSVIETFGAVGTGTGAATSLVMLLVHPLTIWATENVPPVVTVIEAVASPVLHNSEPVKPEAVSTVLPQLFATTKSGADGIIFGEAVALPARLVHPSIV